ncbi:hypothetical protein [Zavarzinella formosa]|uniref:hypothetical protein n=1 Tax=Zavarzinella formosa TaxID=360055 RepID=UPI000315987A|nr:hypothetical protein [Zavarzinella formosa]
MSIEPAWLLKGWLLAQNPPKEISEAIDAIIGAMQKLKPEMRQEISGNTPIHDKLAKAAIPATPEIHIEEPTPKKPRAPWSEERKAMQADRMRATQARLKEARAAAPGEAQAPSKAGA